MAKSPKKVVIKMNPSELFSYFTCFYEVVGVFPDRSRKVFKRCLSLENATEFRDFVSRNHLFGCSSVFVYRVILWL